MISTKTAPNIKALRDKLDIMTERIIIGLKDRSEFKYNEAVYIVDRIPIKGRPGISFLEFGLESLEIFHASLGRYDYKDQFPFFSKNPPKSPAERVIPPPTVQAVDISIKDELISYYQKFLPRLSIEGDDPTTYGETVSIDSTLLMLIHERINSVGRYVAQSKLDNTPEILENISNTEKLKDMLRNPVRENEVVNMALKSAKRYLKPKRGELKAEQLLPIQDFFRWIIDKTIEVEIIYLQKLAELQKRV